MSIELSLTLFALFIPTALLLVPILVKPLHKNPIANTALTWGFYTLGIYTLTLSTTIIKVLTARAAIALTGELNVFLYLVVLGGRIGSFILFFAMIFNAINIYVLGKKNERMGDDGAEER